MHGAYSEQEVRLPEIEASVSIYESITFEYYRTCSTLQICTHPMGRKAWFIMSSLLFNFYTQYTECIHGSTGK